jgi:hypothetical protein
MLTMRRVGLSHGNPCRAMMAAMTMACGQPYGVTPTCSSLQWTFTYSPSSANKLTRVLTSTPWKGSISNALLECGFCTNITVSPLFLLRMLMFTCVSGLSLSRQASGTSHIHSSTIIMHTTVLSLEKDLVDILDQLQPSCPLEGSTAVLLARLQSFLNAAASIDPDESIDWKGVVLQNASILTMDATDMKEFVRLLGSVLGDSIGVAKVLQQVTLNHEQRAYERLVRFTTTMDSLFELAECWDLRKRQNFLLHIFKKTPSIFLKTSLRTSTVQNSYEALFNVCGVDVTLSALTTQPLLLTYRSEDVLRLFDILQKRGQRPPEILTAITKNPTLLQTTHQMASETIAVLEEFFEWDQEKVNTIVACSADVLRYKGEAIRRTLPQLLSVLGSKSCVFKAVKTNPAIMRSGVKLCVAALERIFESETIARRMYMENLSLLQTNSGTIDEAWDALQTACGSKAAARNIIMLCSSLLRSSASTILGTHQALETRFGPKLTLDIIHRYSSILRFKHNVVVRGYEGEDKICLGIRSHHKNTSRNNLHKYHLFLQECRRHLARKKYARPSYCQNQHCWWLNERLWNYVWSSSSRSLMMNLMNLEKRVSRCFFVFVSCPCYYTYLASIVSFHLYPSCPHRCLRCGS